MAELILTLRETPVAFLLALRHSGWICVRYRLCVYPALLLVLLPQKDFLVSNCITEFSCSVRDLWYKSLNSENCFSRVWQFLQIFHGRPSLSLTLYFRGRGKYFSGILSAILDRNAILEIIFFSTSGSTAHALFPANEMSTWNSLSQSLSLSVPQDKGNAGSGNEIEVNVRREVGNARRVARRQSEVLNGYLH